MSLTISGGQSLIKPDMERAFQNMTAHAKKQFEETGSLEGFAEEYTSTSAEGQVTVSVSAIGAALYDKSASENSYILAYKVVDKAADSDGGVGISSGSTTTINTAQDIDAFADQTRDTFKIMHWATVIDGSPEEIDAYLAQEQAKLRAQPGYVELTPTGANDAAASAPAGAAANAKNATAEPNSKLAKAQAQSDAANRLVAKLQDFLDGSQGKSKTAQDRADKAADADRSPETELSRLLTRVDTTA